ncbi:hypothetical protein [Streptomyces sp. NBC_00328]|uniref:hypothetical protein n=1 Tax=Streptomyces sp. NBC_00328 TaxID=2903646 RepID=UPI002E2B9930|nr:hypothetical protein [Streptomyces sp. NBC_00328]
MAEGKHLQVLVEDAERVQLAAGLDSPISQQMIRFLAREADAFMGNMIAAGATALPAITPNADNIPHSLYSAVLDVMLALDGNDLPAGRYVVVSPRVKRHLIEHPSVASAAAHGKEDVTANGVVARLAGSTILTTTAMPTGVDIAAGHSEFATYASQFTGFREGKSEKCRADYIDTLHLYGGKIVRYPELDTKKTDSIFDETRPTRGIVKTAIEWPA